MVSFFNAFDIGIIAVVVITILIAKKIKSIAHKICHRTLIPAWRNSIYRGSWVQIWPKYLYQPLLTLLTFLLDKKKKPRLLRILLFYFIYLNIFR